MNIFVCIFFSRKGRWVPALIRCVVLPFLITRANSQAFHWACANNHAALCRALLSRAPSLDIESVDSAGWTPLMSAASANAEQTLRLLIQLLGENGDEALQRAAQHANGSGATALHYAAAKV